MAGRPLKNAASIVDRSLREGTERASYRESCDGSEGPGPGGAE